MALFRSIPYAALSATLLAGGGTSAQSMGSIDAREDYQQYRIDQGIRSGSLTPAEAARLERGEQRIERYEQRARDDGQASPYERQRLDSMLDREGRAIHRDNNNGQSVDGRGWHGNDGRGRDQGWGRDRDGWGNSNQYGWNRSDRNGWDGNRGYGIERRDTRDEQRIYNGVRDGSLTDGEFNQLERGQGRIDSYESRARSNGSLSPTERDRIDNVQNRESRQIYGDRHNGNSVPATPSGSTQPATGSTSGSPGWGGGGWQRGQQAGGTNWGGWHTQQASATPSMAPRPTMMNASAPAGGRSWGGRH